MMTGYFAAFAQRKPLLKKEKKETVNYLRTTAQLCCHFGRKLGQIITPKFAS